MLAHITALAAFYLLMQANFITVTIPCVPLLSSLVDASEHLMEQQHLLARSERFCICDLILLELIQCYIPFLL
jgi:SpoVK/Ycf46/Vps4 family AAA+-type ATPase